MPQKNHVQIEEMDPMALFDYIFERLALPKPGPALRLISPKSILQNLGIKTLDEITDEALEKIKVELKTKRII